MGRKIKVSDKMRRRIRHMVDITWNAIGPDVLASMEGATMSKEEVAEVISDADHMCFNGQDEEAYEFWRKLPFEQREEVVLSSLIYDSYGY